MRANRSPPIIRAATGAAGYGLGVLRGDGSAAWGIEAAGIAEPACPKHMVYGPCGGVRHDGRCEVAEHRCPFVDRDVVPWTGPPPPPVVTFEAALGPPGRRPVIVTDLRVRPFDPASVAEVTAVLAADADAVLIGDHQRRPDLPPTVLARLVHEAGGRPWITLTCRDRTRVVLESELAGLAVSGVRGVHCVTGDARAPTVRPDASQVFDIDGTRLAALAAAAGLCPSVAATPTAPPVHLRPARLAQKERAGAAVCFVNHAGGPAAVATFVDDARRAGVTMPFVACVAVITDATSLHALERFPGLVVDPEVRTRVLGASNGRAEGIAAAVDEAERMLAIDGVVGVDLSGSATAGPELESALIMAEVATAIRERAGTHR
jgi:5,10-methylenetetrahydrofolate reductase